MPAVAVAGGGIWGHFKIDSFTVFTLFLNDMKCHANAPPLWHPRPAGPLYPYGTRARMRMRRRHIDINMRWAHPQLQPEHA